MLRHPSEEQKPRETFFSHILSDSDHIITNGQSKRSGSLPRFLQDPLDEVNSVRFRVNKNGERIQKKAQREEVAPVEMPSSESADSVTEESDSSLEESYESSEENKKSAVESDDSSNVSDPLSSDKDSEEASKKKSSNKKVELKGMTFNSPNKPQIIQEEEKVLINISSPDKSVGLQHENASQDQIMSPVRRDKSQQVV